MVVIACLGGWGEINLYISWKSHVLIVDIHLEAFHTGYTVWAIKISR